MSELQIIREWISKQPHLPQDIEDTWLKSFLRGCENSVEKCKPYIDKYYSLRTLYPEYFTNRDPTSEEIRKESLQIPRILLPERSPEGYKILLIAFMEKDPSEYDIQLCFRRFCMFRDLMITTGATDIICIIDLKNITLSHVNKFLPYLQVNAQLVTDVVPIHTKQIHFINVNKFGKAAISTGVPFLKEKMRNRIHIYTADDIEQIYEFVPKTLLPTEYGGLAGTIQDLNGKMQTQLESMKEWFLTDEKRKTDESKRPKDGVKSEMFGMDGTFKQLRID